jgi:hypothetical protein
MHRAPAVTIVLVTMPSTYARAVPCWRSAVALGIAVAAPVVVLTALTAMLLEPAPRIASWVTW